MFTFDDSLDLVTAEYDTTGSFLGFQNVDAGFLQFCKFPEAQMKAAFLFAAPQKRNCRLSPAAVFEEETIFREIYLNFTTNGIKTLYPLIVKISCDESCTIPTKYNYFRRFFMADTISTIQAGVTQPTYVRIAKQIKLIVKTRVWFFLDTSHFPVRNFRMEYTTSLKLLKSTFLLSSDLSVHY